MKKKKEKTGLCLFKPNSLLRFLFFFVSLSIFFGVLLSGTRRTTAAVFVCFFFLNVLLFIYVISISVVLKGEA